MSEKKERNRKTHPKGENKANTHNKDSQARLLQKEQIPDTDVKAEAANAVPSAALTPLSVDLYERIKRALTI